MNSHKHTPGPWRLGTPGPNGCYTVGTECGLMTAMVAHSINEPDQAVQALADAKLIAAAPNILRHLELMVHASRQDSAAYLRSCMRDAEIAIEEATA